MDVPQLPNWGAWLAFFIAVLTAPVGIRELWLYCRRSILTVNRRYSEKTANRIGERYLDAVRRSKNSTEQAIWISKNAVAATLGKPASSAVYVLSMAQILFFAAITGSTAQMSERLLSPLAVFSCLLLSMIGNLFWSMGSDAAKALEMQTDLPKFRAECEKKIRLLLFKAGKSKAEIDDAIAAFNLNDSLDIYSENPFKFVGTGTKIDPPASDEAPKASGVFL